MPSTSNKQHNFMNAIAHSPKFAAKAGVPTKVGKDFVAADKKQLKFSEGGGMKSKTASRKVPKAKAVKAMSGILGAITKGGTAKVNPLAALGGAGGAGLSGGLPMGMKKGGSTCGMMKRGGTVKKSFGMGGLSRIENTNDVGAMKRGTELTKRKPDIMKRGTSMMSADTGFGKLNRGTAMKIGGTVKKARGGGIEKQGKTKGKIFKRGGHVKARA